MLAAFFRFDAGTILIFSICAAIALIMLLLGHKLKGPNDRAIGNTLAIVSILVGLGASLWVASSNASNYQHVQEVARDLKLEGYVVANGGIRWDGRQATVVVGERGCLQRFDIGHVYGRDADGYKRRWRPAILTNRDGSLVGLGRMDFASLRAACTP